MVFVDMWLSFFAELESGVRSAVADRTPVMTKMLRD